MTRKNEEKKIVRHSLPEEPHNRINHPPPPPRLFARIVLPEQKRSRQSPSWSRPLGTWPDALSATPARPAGTPRPASCPGVVLGRHCQPRLQLEEARVRPDVRKWWEWKYVKLCWLEKKGVAVIKRKEKSLRTHTHTYVYIARPIDRCRYRHISPSW